MTSPQLTPRRRQVFTLLAAVLVLGALWWAQQPGTSPSDQPHQNQSSQGTDPDSGLQIVAVGDLPPEAAEILRVIDRGGPFAEDEDGGTFGNREAILPDQPMGYYKEYTVPTPGADTRGARRIVAGEGGEYYWTEDHYSSFSRIER